MGSESLACVASVSSRGSFRKLGQEQKTIFFCFCSNFRAITRLETLATQATESWAIDSEAMRARGVIGLVKSN